MARLAAMVGIPFREFFSAAPARPAGLLDAARQRGGRAQRNALMDARTITGLLRRWTGEPSKVQMARVEVEVNAELQQWLAQC